MPVLYLCLLTGSSGGRLQHLSVCLHWPATEGDVDVVSSAVATETNSWLSRLVDTWRAGPVLAVRLLHIEQAQKCQTGVWVVFFCFFFPLTSGRGTGGAGWRWWRCRRWQRGPRQAAQLITDVFQPIVFLRHARMRIWKRRFSTRPQLYWGETSTEDIAPPGSSCPHQ